MPRWIALPALALSLTLTVAPACGAPEIAVVSREDLREDLGVLRRALETVHPGLYRYQTRPGFLRRFAALERALDRPMRRDSAFVEIARFAATVRCGHTHAGPFNQGRLVTAEVVQRGGRVPFHFRWLDRRMVVTRDLGAGGVLPPGTEVVRLNGVPARDLLARMLPLASADGGNDAQRASKLEVQGRARFETFDLFLPLLVPDAERAIRLEVRVPGERAARHVELEPRSWEDRVRDHEAAAGGALPWTLDLSDSSLAVLRMTSWAVYNSGVNWDSTLHALMDRVVASGRRALVLDLRDNAGGVDAGNVILQRLVGRDTAFDGYTRHVRYRRTPADLDPALDTWDDAFRDQTAYTPAEPAADGLYPLNDGVEGSGGIVIPARSPRFTGRVFVLVGPVNSSATFQFAEKVRARRLGTLVGSTTGGSQRGINGGQFFFLRLPKSRIEVDLPVIAFMPKEARPDSGIAPDIAVRVRPADVAAGRDVEMEAVRRELARRPGTRP